MQSQPISILVRNNSRTHDHEVTIFDAARALQKGEGGNWGNSRDLELVVVDGTMDYGQTLYYTVGNAYRIARVDIQGSTTSTNVCTKLRINNIDYCGKQMIIENCPSLNKFQQLPNVVSFDYGWNLDLLAKFQHVVPAGSAIVYRFYPNVAFHPTLQLENNVATEKYSDPRTHGVEYKEPVFNPAKSAAVTTSERDYTKPVAPKPAKKKPAPKKKSAAKKK
jgi:hypothetical protein